jgi:acetyl-CoA synthetase
MKEGRDKWLQPLLDAASDNNVAEIMDAEIRCLFCTPPALQENQKVWFTLLQAIWYIPPIRLRMFLITKMIFFGALLIFWITGHSYILCSLY